MNSARDGSNIVATRCSAKKSPLSGVILADDQTAGLQHSTREGACLGPNIPTPLAFRQDTLLFDIMAPSKAEKLRPEQTTRRVFLPCSAAGKLIRLFLIG